MTPARQQLLEAARKAHWRSYAPEEQVDELLDRRCYLVMKALQAILEDESFSDEQCYDIIAHCCQTLFHSIRQTPSD